MPSCPLVATERLGSNRWYPKPAHLHPILQNLRLRDVRTLVQELVAAKKARVNQLSAIEENSTRLSAAKEQLEVWLRENEHKAANLQEELTPEDVFEATDALARQAVEAQVLHHEVCLQLTLAFIRTLLCNSVGCAKL